MRVLLCMYEAFQVISFGITVSRFEIWEGGGRREGWRRWWCFISQWPLFFFLQLFFTNLSVVDSAKRNKPTCKASEGEKKRRRRRRKTNPDHLNENKFWSLERVFCCFNDSHDLYYVPLGNSLRNSERRKEGGNIRHIVNMTYWYFKCQAMINEGFKVITWETSRCGLCNIVKIFMLLSSNHLITIYFLTCALCYDLIIIIIKTTTTTCLPVQ